MTHGRHLRLEWAQHDGRGCLKIGGWTEAELRELSGLDAGALSRRLAVYPSEALPKGGDRSVSLPMAGRFLVQDGSVWFAPRFPFADRVSYSLLVGSAGDADGAEVWEIRRPSPDAVSTTEVVAIYPTAAELPVNLLRVYVHFSAPMSEGWAARAIRVSREDTGQALEDVFLPPEPELWDAQRMRLTMLLDPGRIKRGLMPNLEFGYPLMEGTTVRIAIDPAFRDASGQPLRAGAGRSYSIGPALRSRIDPTAWRLTVPNAGSRTPLLVEFDRPLDHGLLQHCLLVRDAAGQALSGVAEIGEGECSWRFMPDAPWQTGEHHLLVEPRLEDVAGNSPARVFDRDVTKAQDAPGEREAVMIGFSCDRA
ncbi:MAG: hypothetical protein OXU28_10250 [Chloroflexota bacterium]|nr:hypothetical protein [Rhodospirillaceae bacterium]MDE2960410.1 hypothetical protein [Chloroflexota bacterium]